MDSIIKSTPVRLLFVLLTLIVTVTMCQQAFAQYQYGEGQVRIIFSSSNSTQATTPSSSNLVISSNGYSNSTQATTPSSSPNTIILSNVQHNSTHATTPSSSNPVISSNGYSNSTQSMPVHQSANTIPEFGSIAPIILAISVITIVLLNVKTRFFNTSHSGGI